MGGGGGVAEGWRTLGSCLRSGLLYFDWRTTWVGEQRTGDRFLLDPP